MTDKIKQARGDTERCAGQCQGGEPFFEALNAERRLVDQHIAKLEAESEALRLVLTCPDSSYGTHRCGRCDSEVEP